MSENGDKSAPRPPVEADAHQTDHYPIDQDAIEQAERLGASIVVSEVSDDVRAQSGRSDSLTGGKAGNLRSEQAASDDGHSVIGQLVKQIQHLHGKLRDVDPAEFALSQAPQIPRFSPVHTRTFRGHCAAIYSCAWSPDSSRLASVGMDNNLIIWRPQTGAKLQVVPIQQPYTMSVSFSPSGQSVAYGGLDCCSYIYDGARTVPLYQHSGYVSSVGFLGETQVVSGSADGSACVFDVQKQQASHLYQKHFRDVMSVDSLGANTFATGSCDGFLRVFDHRVQQQVQIFSCLHADANAVKFHPAGNGNLIAAATSANRALVFDRRTDQLLFQFEPQGNKLLELKGLSFSRSGRLLFTAAGQKIIAFDILTGTQTDVGEHEASVTAVEAAPDGRCIASAGWDSLVKIWV